MRKRTLGKTGFKVSEISLGAWQIGGLRYGQVTDAQAHDTVRAYIQGGGNFIDTARGYNESERILGDFFQRNGGRENIYIASKSGANDPMQIESDLEKSLQLLGSDYLDLYYLHSPPDDPDEMNRVLEVYERLKVQGRIRAIGASIKGPDVTEKTVDLCRQYIRSGRVDALMIIHSILRQKNAEIMAEARQADVGLIPRTVLESGFLSGKYSPGHEFNGQDHRVRWTGSRLKRILQQVRDLKAWAVESPYTDLSQVALRFVLDQEGVSSVVIGARTGAQIKQMIDATKLPSLKPALRERLIAEFAGQDADFNTGAS